MSKVALVKCERINKYYRILTPPLGIMYLASYLKQRGKEVRIYDARLYDSDYVRITNELKKFKPDIIGLSAITFEAKSLFNLINNFKNSFPETKIIVGGPFATSYPEDVLARDEIDCVVLGEGERTFNELVDLYNRGNGNLRDIQGIAFKKNDEIIFTKHRDLIDNLDELPFPAWDLINLNGYRNHLRSDEIRGKPYMSIFTSRGCPYHCIYCHNIFGKKFRSRSTENVISEIEILYNEYGINNIEIFDDIFNFDTNRAEEICDNIIEKNIQVNISFPNGLRADIMTKRLLNKLKKAGTKIFVFGVETASPRLQKLLKRNLNLEKVNQTISWAHELKLYSKGFFMIGFPTETREEILQTIEYARNSKLNSAEFSITIPFSGTELMEDYSYLVKKNSKYTDYEYSFGNSNLSEVDDNEIFKLQRIAYRKFYLNMNRLIGIVVNNPNNRLKIFPPGIIRIIPLLFRKRRGL